MIRLLLILLWFLIFIVVTLPVLLFELVYHFINKERSQLQCQKFIRFLMKGVFWLTGSTLTVKGSENIPEGEGVLFVPNHRSYFDFVVTCTQIYPFYNIGKKELSWPPIVGQWVWLIGTLLLDRKDRRAGLKVIGEAAELVKTGKNIMIYPEGTRNKGLQEEPLRFREGSMKISLWSGCKVIPVALLNTRAIYEEHKPWIKPADVRMVYGKPIDPADLTDEDKKRFGAYTRDVIIQMIKEEENAHG